jgi:hypothetical protein
LDFLDVLGDEYWMVIADAVAGTDFIGLFTIAVSD